MKLLALFLEWLRRVIGDWLGRKERDNLVKEKTQDEATIADQAAALRVLHDVDSVPRERLPDASGTKPERKGRRPSNG
jgi:hypothetical protein